MTETAPYGAWRSPITARQVAAGKVRLDQVAFGDDGSLWWSEGRPTEHGRCVIVHRQLDGTVADAMPPGFNARTRVHEYGGGAWLPVGAGLVFANWEDQRLYRVEGDVPVALTPVPSEPRGDRYADLVLSAARDEVWCVRERAVGASVQRDIVAVPLDGSGHLRSLVTDGHFLSNARPSPDGRHLAWLTWNHPRMPWDGTELKVAAIADDGSVLSASTVLGGDDESVFQPEWAGPDALYAVSDRTGWWNLYRVDLGGDVTALCPRQEEFGTPQWVFGLATYGILEDGRVAVLHGEGALDLSILDPATRSLVEVPSPVAIWGPYLRVNGTRVADVGGGPTTPVSVVVLDTTTGHLETVRRSLDVVPDAGYLPEPRAESFPGVGGRPVHALVYPPKNGDYEAPSGERPPFVAFVHGGPTTSESALLDLTVAYFTSRGIGVADVNYGGSSGYGRAYRDLLAGQWGIVDVQDVVAVMHGLAQRGDADGKRLLIRGSSAGGWTVLVALTSTDVFAGGTSLYGVADLTALAQDTHDFESRYLDGLVGPLPEARHLYDERSPLTHVDEISCPVLLLQGLDDTIVPPSQAQLFGRALAAKGIAYAYLPFAGEGHGFHQAETQQRALEAELSFYGQVVGFIPPDIPVLLMEGADS